MTAPAYHVGQILYHRASGERVVVAGIWQDGTMSVSAGIGRRREETAVPDWISGVYSTEPVFVKTASEPDLTFRPVNQYRKPNT